ncbi:hypothetical protein [Stanieria cyanosphaera]|uniref:hypothetical protein n=1 Tax=Stanieria cyanosphaera TaxID=102116 RepID=UPI0012373EF7|nr:hypothetical protein [Stanieria cyanosphaera]
MNLPLNYELIYLIFLYFLAIKLLFAQPENDQTHQTTYFLNYSFAIAYQKRLRDWDTQQLIKRVHYYLLPQENIQEILLFYQNSFVRVSYDTPLSVGVLTHNRIIVLDLNFPEPNYPQIINYDELLSIEIKEGKYFDTLKLFGRSKHLTIRHIIKGNTINFVQATAKPYQVHLLIDEKTRE